MPAPVARSRALVGGAVLVVAAAGSLLLSAGTSSSATSPPVRPFYGPVAVPPPAQPLVRTDGPLLPPLVAAARIPLAAATRPLGPVVAAAAPVVLHEVGPDSTVAHVRALQRLLNARDAGLRVDGAWGPATSAALRRVQDELGLPVDGRAGPATLSALRT